MPKSASAEYKELQRRSITPWLGLVVTSIAQALFAEGHRQPSAGEDSPLWKNLWQPNSLDSRQSAVYRAALTHGLSYVTALPGKNPLTGADAAVIRGSSVKRMAAYYADEAEDDYPEYAIRADLVTKKTSNGSEEKRWIVQFYDATSITDLSCDEDGEEHWQFHGSRTHGVGVVPVVRFTNNLDLDGETVGEVAPYIPLASRIDQDTFDRLVVQRFSSWKVRYIAGMTKPETDEERRAASLALRQEDLLVSGDPATKFGTLDATSLDGFINARDADIRDLAAVTQTPPHHLLGLSPNLSAEALAAAESALMRKVEERRHSFGESWETVLRLGAWISGDQVAAEDFGSQIRWRDIESRSLAQVADALGKLAAQLHVPVEMLWHRIPGWTDQDTLEAKELLESGAEEALLATLLGQTQDQPTGVPGGAVT